MNALAPTRGGALAPASLGDMMKMSEMLAASSMVPNAYKQKPQDILVCLMWGAEVGLGPIQALNGISVINGKPAMWGDAALALVRGHPACAGIREWIEGEGDKLVAHCEVTRRGQAPERRSFSVTDAKKAGLWGKAGPWQQYPTRMLQMRARGFAIRDVFPDALRGVITAEEAQDYPAEPRNVPNLAAAPAIDGPPSYTASMSSFSFTALDEQLSQFGTIDEITGYLTDPKVKDARARAEKRGPEAANKWAVIVQTHIARVCPEEREPGEDEPEEVESAA